MLGSDPYKSDYIAYFELRQGRLGPSSVDKTNDIVIDNWNPTRYQSGMIRARGKLTAFRQGDFFPATLILKESKFLIGFAVLRHSAPPCLPLLQFENHD